MKISEIATFSMNTAREMKEAKVADPEDPGTDINNMVEGWRTGFPVVLMLPQGEDGKSMRDPTLRAAYVAAVAFGCDVLSITQETWHTAGEHAAINPITGRPWEQGQMEEVVIHHDGLAKGWIIASLLTTVVNRAGDIVGGMSDYEIVTVDGSQMVHWLTEVKAEEASFGGAMADAFIHYMNLPSMQQMMLKEAPEVVSVFRQGLSPVQMQAHQDCATVKFLAMRPEIYAGSLMLMADSEERAEVLQRSLGGGERFG